MYIPDLTNVSINPMVNIFAIGWLAKEIDFPKSEAHSQENYALLQKTFDSARYSGLFVARTRGPHYCEFCERRDVASNACLLVRAKSQSHYYLANLLLPHYVGSHFYDPPAAFLESLPDQYSLSPEELQLEKFMLLESPEGLALEQKRIERLFADHPELRELHDK